jgi:hypothetical protein
VREDQIFGQRCSVITGNTTSSEDSFPSDEFFLDIDNFFGDMGYNIDANVTATTATPATCM